MMESLVLFESIVNSRWFLRTSIILFLNKIDVFRTKLPKVPLQRYFPDYGGNVLCVRKNADKIKANVILLTGGQDPAKAAKYILWRFTQTNRAKLNIYPQ